MVVYSYFELKEGSHTVRFSSSGFSIDRTMRVYGYVIKTKDCITDLIAVVMSALGKEARYITSVEESYLCTYSLRGTEHKETSIFRKPDGGYIDGLEEHSFEFSLHSKNSPVLLGKQLAGVYINGRKL